MMRGLKNEVEGREEVEEDEEDDDEAALLSRSTLLPLSTSAHRDVFLFFFALDRRAM